MNWADTYPDKIPDKIIRGHDTRVLRGRPLRLRCIRDFWPAIELDKRARYASPARR
jgi:hypothetical protein